MLLALSNRLFLLRLAQFFVVTVVSNAKLMLVLILFKRSGGSR